MKLGLFHQYLTWLGYFSPRENFLKTERKTRREKGNIKLTRYAWLITPCLLGGIFCKGGCPGVEEIFIHHFIFICLQTRIAVRRTDHNGHIIQSEEGVAERLIFSAASLWLIYLLVTLINGRN
ncbi:hypothetical protein [Klebsiella quasipneumoniae]|uniref:hypothetical protein n=2 Tax=Klebsiella quasipneumoniae TaxID=1463165 RepID=UPI001D27690D|nr:hypothetical protein [Klebsiella quasipneumoniae]